MSGHQPTEAIRGKVNALASFGVPQEDIAAFIGISHVTLRKHYSEELRLSAIKANAQVGQFLFNLASGNAMKDKGNPASWGDCSRAAMFWAKTRMGWRETNRHEITGADGGPIRQQHEGAVSVNLRGLTDEELATLEKTLAKAVEGGEA